METDTVRKQSADLREAFEQAEYHVRVAGKDWLVRAGGRHAGLDRALNGRRWAILTAHNPGGRRIDADVNRRREAALRDEIGQRGWSSFEAINRDPRGHWPDEPGLLVAGAPVDAVVALARDFGQAAILAAEKGAPARVEFLGNRPGSSSRAPRPGAA
ncbi:MAG: DUF3293 domain-containing protein [Gammaproteobacteria bacterium]|jgi:hypothetical protein|nr:DUF3293 domain-containing protein [Gammaproteobacteria bacterium]